MSLRPGAIEPAVLIVGAEEGFGHAVARALMRYGVHLEHTTLEEAAQTAVVAAPDLIVLATDAAKDDGRQLLAELQVRPETSVIPVALIQEDTALDARLRAFRHGAAAILPKKASVDELARRIDELAREIPNRSDETLGDLGEVTLEELVKTLGAELRSGILSVADPEGKEAVRLVLGGGRPLAQLIEEFVHKARKHVRSAEPLRYEFEARAGGTIQLFDGTQDKEAETNVALQGLRIVLADSNAPRAEAVAHELRRYGAEVIVTDLAPTETRLSQIRLADPSILLIGEEHLQGDGYELVRRMRRDTRLRWASLLVVRWAELWREEQIASVERLAATLDQLAEPERSLHDQAERLECFDTRLEIVGPARTLRALTTSSRGLRVTVRNPRLQVELDLANGLIVGALARNLEQSGQTLEGSQALAALLQVSTGRVQIDQVDHPARANLMATIDMALGIAAGETPPIQPSIPAPPLATSPTPNPLITRPASPQAGLAKPRSSNPALDATLLPDGNQSPWLTPGAVPSIPVQAWTPSSADAPLTSNELAAPQPYQAPSQPQPAYSLATSTRESSSPPPQELVPPSATPASAAATSLPLSPIDLRLGQLLRISETGRPSGRLMAFLSGLALLQISWILLFVSASAPPASSPLTPVQDAQAPLVEAPRSSSGDDSSPEPAGPAIRGAQPSPPNAAPAQPSFPARDGSDKSAPTCDELLSKYPAREGRFPGAANEQARAGKQALITGKLFDAHDHYCRAVRWDDSSAATWLSLAQVYMLRRDAKQAAAAAERSLALAPDDPVAQVVLADALAHLGEADRARELWKNAAKLSVPEDKTYALLAKRDLGEGQRAERAKSHSHAERMYRRVALLTPDKPEGPTGLARMLLVQEETDAARLWAQYAIRISPGHADAHLVYGDVLQAAGDEDGAQKAWRTALELRPNHPVAADRLRASR